MTYLFATKYDGLTDVTVTRNERNWDRIMIVK